MTEHAFLPPSGADCWVACHKWPWMQREFPDLGDKTAADEGTLAALALSHLANGQPLPAGVTDEMAGHVADTLAYALGLGVGEWNSEQRLMGKSIHDSQNWGTPDLYGWDTFNLHVIDLKYGHGFINHIGNWQCINYVSLILDQLNMSYELEQKITVHIHIAQPRCFVAEPFRCWTIPLIDLRAYFNTLRNAAGMVMRMDAKASTGPQCDHCTGRHACATLQTVAGRVIDMSYDLAPVPMQGPAIAAAYAVGTAAIKRLEAFVSGIEAQAMHAIKNGAQLPGLAIEYGQGREQWTLDADTLTQMADAMQLPITAPKPVTPAQARVLLKKAGIPQDVLNDWVSRPAGAAKLTTSKTFKLP